MPDILPIATFSQKDVQTAAEWILEQNPHPVPKYRLFNEVLRLRNEDPELELAKHELAHSKWVRQLQNAQLPDGSWGRFHSQDTKLKSVFRTSEEAIDRAFSLGMERSHPVLEQVKKYIVDVLLGRAHIGDRQEKNEAWPLLIRCILAGRLAQIEPTNPLLDESWDCLREVTQRAFQSGHYRLADEAQAFLQVANTHVPKGFIESQHTLWILSARQLPGHLEQQLVEWVWNKVDGIRYIRAPFINPTPGSIAGWLRSMNILRRFEAWKSVCVDTLNQIWSSRGEDGFWDFGPQAGWRTDFPISDNWRQGVNRKIDYSTFLLALFSKYFN